MEHEYASYNPGTKDTEDPGVGLKALCLDEYRAPGSGEHPGVLLIHGGRFVRGDKRMSTGDPARYWLPELADYLSAHGMDVYVANYRLAPLRPEVEDRRADPPDSVLDNTPRCVSGNGLCEGANYDPSHPIADLQTAIQWIKAQAGTSNKVAALGGSAGAVLALVLGTRESTQIRPNAVVSWSGAASTLLFTNCDFADTDCQQQRSAEYSPAQNADKAVPTLLGHGIADRKVPFVTSVHMYEALVAEERSAEIALYPTSAHGAALIDCAKVRARDFLRYRLGLDAQQADTPAKPVECAQSALSAGSEE